MKPLKNVAASVHQRLLNIARQSERPFNELVELNRALDAIPELLQFGWHGNG